MTSVNIPDDEFIIKHKTNKYTVSKFKVSLYSKKFRALVIENPLKELEIEANVESDVFNTFVQAIQGEAYEINENVYDLYTLGKIWQVDTLKTEVKVYIKDNPYLMSVIMNKVVDEDDKVFLETFREIIACNFDEVMRSDRLLSLPLETIRSIVFNPDFQMKNMPAYFDLVIQLLDRYGPVATSFATKLDFRLLKTSQAMKFLDHGKVDRVAACPIAIQITKNYIHSTIELEKDVEKALKRISNIQSPTKELNGIYLKIDQINNKTVAVADNISKSSKQTKTDFDELLKRITSVDKLERNKMKSVSSMNDIATKDMKILEQTVNDLRNKQQDLKRKRSLVQCDEVDLDPPVSELNLIPVNFNKNDPERGIIETLKEEYDGEIDEFIKITSSGTSNGDILSILNKKSNDSWYSATKPGQSIVFDFLTRQVTLTDYTIKTVNYSEGAVHLRSWALEGSKDMMTWILLDTQNTNMLNGPNRIASFKCRGEAEAFRYIRLRQTDVNWRGDHSFGINFIEFFGVLVEL